MEGRKLGDRYEVISRVGGGGMAVVYKARDVLLNRYVAIKVLNESLSNDSEFVRRFSREAQAAASLSHPSVVSVYDVGQENHTHYIVMEYIEGPTLKEYIQQYSPLTSEEIVSIASQICDALAHAHENQIVHRDIKPHNILLGYNGRAKVTDFGIARATSSSTITQAGSVMGSVHYFSPEQARGGLIGEKSDIYSLGVVLYEMVTGELPFDGDSAISVAMKHLQEPVIDPEKLNPDVPQSIHHIILKALEKDPDQRFESARAMKHELDAVFHYDRMEEPPLRTHRDGDLDKTIPAMKGLGHAATEESKKSPSKVGDQTLANLERLRQVPADKDQTMLGRTVVWLENVQANMPWWQKLLFGLFTFFVIIALAVFAFDAVMGWMGQDTAEVPDVVGKSRAEAVEVLKDKGISVGDVNEEPSSEKKGTVIEQSEQEGAELGEGESIDLTVSTGSEKAGEHEQEQKEMVEVKDYIGEWESNIQGAGYEIEIIYWPHSSKTGKAFASDPAPGEKVEKGGTVRVWISNPTEGKKKIPPPNQ
ncbi:Stk1 family PASTA domain-containing Ser/Thr kinase [Paludifilum halophilum]|uniref:Stk1 family PASTA domain-containing Ser/Thr kinase n=1 Tax=Paludifilum halophilum TaxID=1642702 RepID=UPI00146BF909|nr:Stk1 family PASTA domain-containing Ser/Thr kinase [Paludifilum halophilum]